MDKPLDFMYGRLLFSGTVAGRSVGTCEIPAVLSRPGSGNCLLKDLPCAKAISLTQLSSLVMHVVISHEVFICQWDRTYVLETFGSY